MGFAHQDPKTGSCTKLVNVQLYRFVASWLSGYELVSSLSVEPAQTLTHELISPPVDGHDIPRVGRAVFDLVPELGYVCVNGPR